MKCCVSVLSNPHGYLVHRIEGRTPDLSEWKELIGKVEELNEDLHRTQFDWTVEDETAT